jgi:hypothetical protein
MTAVLIFGCNAEPDLEMGLLRRSSPDPITRELVHEDGSDNNATQISALDHADHRNNLHEVIGDALEVFSRHLRAHR